MIYRTGVEVIVILLFDTYLKTEALLVCLLHFGYGMENEFTAGISFAYQCVSR